jgi:hypothetical protein
MVGQKMDYSDIHAKIRELTQPILSTFNRDFSYVTWTINYDRDKVFNLDLVTKDDKRQRYGRVGRIQVVKFVLTNPEYADLTFVEMVIELDRLNLVKKIKATKEEIEHHEKNLADAQKYLKELEEDLKGYD